jgi:hypothetical protein
MALTTAVTAAALGVTAGPAMAAPMCRAYFNATTLLGEGNCTNGDPAVLFQVVVLCRQWIGQWGDPNYEYYSSSAWRPTTETITGVPCNWGGSGVYAFTEMTAPPPAPSANLTCESGANRVFCDVQHDLAGTVQIRWTVNGGHIASWDNRSHISTSCRRDTVIAVTVSNVTGSAASSWSGCRSGPWQ